MKSLIILVALVAFAHAATSPEVAVLKQTSDVNPDGSYAFAVELDNGVHAEEHGQVKAVGPEQAEVSAAGSYGWTSPEGEKVEVSYVADENGYQPQGSHIPVPPPVPEAIQRALEWIAAHPEPEQKRI